VELSWSTFVLEIINFLALVWILKRFLYKPVLDIIARRRSAIEKTQADAATLMAAAEQLQDQYGGRLTEWERERQEARATLARELDDERARRLADLHITLEQERAKADVVNARRQADALSNIEQTAMQQGARFAARLLQEASGPELEARLVELVISDLAGLSAERLANMRNNFAAEPESILVHSAFPLADEQRQRLQQALAVVAAAGTPVHFAEDRELMAGVQIAVGAWVLAANLRDELAGFAELTHGE
jgi:F-type H+-transporting ATPase subunit b